MHELERLPDGKLAVIDPIGSFLGGNTDAHRDNEVRAVSIPVLNLRSTGLIPVHQDAESTQNALSES